MSGTEFKEAVSFELAEEELCHAQLTMASQNLGILSFASTRIGRGPGISYAAAVVI